MNNIAEIELKFLVQWDEDKTKTWSGTTWSLFNALQKYFKVEEVCLPNNRTLWRHILHYLGYGDNYLKEKKLHGSYVNSRLAGEAKIFQFGEIIFDSPLRKTYIYQDLSTNYLYDILIANKELFIHSGFNKMSKKGVKAHKEFEFNYYQSCSGIFTMSNWLADYLINKLGISASKVHPVGGV